MRKASHMRHSLKSNFEILAWGEGLSNTRQSIGASGGPIQHVDQVFGERKDIVVLIFFEADNPAARADAGERVAVNAVSARRLKPVFFLAHFAANILDV